MYKNRFRNNIGLLPVREGMKLLCVSSLFHTDWVGKIHTVTTHTGYYVIKQADGRIWTGAGSLWEIYNENTNEDITDWL